LPGPSVRQIDAAALIGLLDSANDVTYVLNGQPPDSDLRSVRASSIAKAGFIVPELQSHAI